MNHYYINFLTNIMTFTDYSFNATFNIIQYNCIKSYIKFIKSYEIKLLPVSLIFHGLSKNIKKNYTLCYNEIKVVQ